MLILFCLFLIYTAQAGEVEELIEYALKKSPRLKVYENLKASTKRREEYSKSLPNPSLSFGLNNLPLNRPYPSKYEPMSSFSVGIGQRYVLGVKRERDALMARAEEEVFEVQEDVAKRELIRDIKLKYLEWLYIQKREEISKRSLEEIYRLEKLAEENYKLGRSKLSDILSLKGEALRIEGEVKRLKEERNIVKEEIDSLVGKSFELKGEGSEIKEALEDINLEKTPFIKQALKERERIRAEVERLKVEYLPDFEVMAEYMIRPGLENMVNLRVSFDIPIRRSIREDLLVLGKMQELKAKDWEIENLKLYLRRDVVCGMDVRISPRLMAQVKLKDGSYKYAESPKHILQYYLKNKDRISELWVKDYESGKWIDGAKAFYVIVHEGPMGDDLLAFQSRISAQRHAGKGKVYSLKDIDKEF
ncbi:MAG: TolC family protein, partial [Alishewanella aestuarii]